MPPTTTRHPLIYVHLLTVPSSFPTLFSLQHQSFRTPLNQCQACTVCSKDEYESRPCAHGANRICAKVSPECTRYERELRAPGLTSDRACGPILCVTEARASLEYEGITTCRKAGRNNEGCTEARRFSTALNAKHIIKTLIDTKLCDCLEECRNVFACQGVHMRVDVEASTSKCRLLDDVGNDDDGKQTATEDYSYLVERELTTPTSTETTTTMEPACCDSGRWRTQELSANGPISVCKVLTARCEMSHYRAALPLPQPFGDKCTQPFTSDMRCETLSECTKGQVKQEPVYDFGVLMFVIDRQCDEIIACNQTTQYEVLPPKISETDSNFYESNRVCKNLRICASNEFENVAPTATSNRNCKLKTHCCYNCPQYDEASNAVRLPGKFLEYEATPATATSDRTCLIVRDICETGTFEVAGTLSNTTNRNCEMCLKRCPDGLVVLRPDGNRPEDGMM